MDESIKSALRDKASDGEVDAAKLLVEIDEQQRIDALCKELFGV